MYGKRIFVWSVPASGNIDTVLSLATSGSFQGLDFKTNEGPYLFGSNNPKGGIIPNLSLEDANKIRQAGIDVGGWGPVYGNKTTAEADFIISQIVDLKLSSYILDIEGLFEYQKSVLANAALLCNRIKASCPQVKLGFCCFAEYKSPTSGTQWHNKDMYKIFMSLCDFGVPMMYWGGSTAQDALTLLKNSGSQWKEISCGKPILPAGRAYIGDGGKPTVEAISAFAEATKESYVGITWWDLQQVVPIIDVWNALKATPTWEAGTLDIEQINMMITMLKSWEADPNIPVWAKNVLSNAQTQLQNGIHGA